MNNLVKLLKTYSIQRASAFRINRIMKTDVLIIDEIGYTPIDRKEANLSTLSLRTADMSNMLISRGLLWM